MGDVFKNRERGCFFGGAKARIAEEGLQNRKGDEPSPHRGADSHGLASREQER